MKIRPQLRVLQSIILMSVFGLTAVLPAAGSGLTLCVCHDGHISFEIECFATYCCPPDKCEADAFATGMNSKNSVGGHSCVDITLLPSSEVGAVQTYYQLQSRDGSNPVTEFVGHYAFSPPTSSDVTCPVSKLGDYTARSSTSTVVLIV